jgi:hypothetical protein
VSDHVRHRQVRADGHDRQHHLVLGPHGVGGDGEGGDLADARVADHRRLHLEGGDVLASAADAVLGAVQVGVAVVAVRHAEVAGVEPEVPERLHRGIGLPR